jgi:TonB family protein
MNRGHSAVSRTLRAATIATLGMMPAFTAAVAQDSPEPPPVGVGPNVTPPKPTKRVDGQYTAEAIRAGLQGEVFLEVTVGSTGQVREVKVSCSIPELDTLAVDAARQWEFEPAIANGIPVPVIVTSRCRLRSPSPRQRSCARRSVRPPNRRSA